MFGIIEQIKQKYFRVLCSSRNGQLVQARTVYGPKLIGGQ